MKRSEMDQLAVALLKQHADWLSKFDEEVGQFVADLVAGESPDNDQVGRMMNHDHNADNEYVGPDWVAEQRENKWTNAQRFEVSEQFEAYLDLAVTLAISRWKRDPDDMRKTGDERLRERIVWAWGKINNAYAYALQYA